MTLQRSESYHSSDADTSATSFSDVDLYPADVGQYNDDPPQGLEGEKAAFKGVFGILYTVSKEKGREALWFVVFRLFMDVLQLFLLVVNPVYGFHINPKNLVWRIVSFITLNDFMSARGYSFFLACLYVMVAGLVLAIGLCAWVGVSFQSNTFSYVWPIVFLRWFAKVFFQVLDVASMTLFLIALDCQYFDRPPEMRYHNQEFPNIECWSPGNLVHVFISAASFIVFVLMAGAFQMAEIELDLLTPNILPMAHTRVEVQAFMIKVIMTCASVFILNFKWLSGILFVSALVLLYLYLYWVPHYTPWVNHVRVASCLMVFYAATIFVFIAFQPGCHGCSTEELQNYDKYATWALWAGMAPAALLGAALSYWRQRYFFVTVLNRFRNASPTTRYKELYDFKDAREVEILTRCCRVFVNVDRDVDPAAVALAELVLKVGNSLMPQDPYVVILSASFLMSRGSYQSGYNLLQSVKERKLSLMEMFAVFAHEQQHTQQSASSGDQATDLVSYVEFKRNYSMVVKAHRAALLAMRAFWTKLLQRSVSMHSLTKLVRSMDEAIRNTDQVYRQVMVRHSGHAKVVRLYAMFQETVKRDPWVAAHWFAEAERLQVSETSKVGASVLGDVEIQDPELKVSLMAALDESDSTSVGHGDLTGVLVMDAQSVLQLFNQAASTLLGYGKNELKGRNVSVLLPAPINAVHHLYVRKYIETGEHKILDTSWPVVMLHKDQRMVPVMLCVTRVHGTNEASMFLALFKVLPEPPGVCRAWISPEGKLASVDAAFTEFLGHRPNDINSQNITCLLKDAPEMSKLMYAARVRLADIERAQFAAKNAGAKKMLGQDPTTLALVQQAAQQAANGDKSVAAGKRGSVRLSIGGPPRSSNSGLEGTTTSGRKHPNSARRSSLLVALHASVANAQATDRQERTSHNQDNKDSYTVEPALGSTVRWSLEGARGNNVRGSVNGAAQLDLTAPGAGHYTSPAAGRGGVPSTNDPSHAALALLGTNPAWFMNNTWAYHKYAGPVPVDVKLTNTSIMSFKFQLLEITQSNSRQWPMMLVSDWNGRVVHVSSALAASLGLSPADITAGGAPYALHAVMPEPFNHLHVPLLAQAASSMRPPPYSCRSGLSVLLLRQTPQNTGRPQPAPFRISVQQRRLQDSDERGLHVTTFEETSVREALDERRLCLTLDSQGTVLTVGKSPASLFGRDPSCLVGRNVASFIDVFQAGAGHTITPKDALSGGGVPTVECTESEMLLLHMATRALAQPGESWRVGVLQAQTAADETELTTRGPLERVLLAAAASKRTPAVMALTCSFEQNLPGAVGHSRRASNASQARMSSAGQLVEGMSTMHAGSMPSNRFAPVYDIHGGQKDEDDDDLLGAAVSAVMAPTVSTSRLATPNLHSEGGWPAGTVQPPNAVHINVASVTAGGGRTSVFGESPENSSEARRLVMRVELWRADMLTSLLEVDVHGHVSSQSSKQLPLYPQGLVLGTSAEAMVGQPLHNFIPQLTSFPMDTLFKPDAFKGDRTGVATRHVPGLQRKRSNLKVQDGVDDIRARLAAGPEHRIKVPHPADGGDMWLSVQAVRKPTAAGYWVLIRPHKPACGPSGLLKRLLSPNSHSHKNAQAAGNSPRVEAGIAGRQSSSGSSSSGVATSSGGASAAEGAPLPQEEALPVPPVPAAPPHVPHVPPSPRPPPPRADSPLVPVVVVGTLSAEHIAATELSVASLQQHSNGADNVALNGGMSGLQVKGAAHDGGAVPAPAEQGDGDGEGSGRRGVRFTNLLKSLSRVLSRASSSHSVVDQGNNNTEQAAVDEEDAAPPKSSNDPTRRWVMSNGESFHRRTENGDVEANTAAGAYAENPEVANDAPVDGATHSKQMSLSPRSKSGNAGGTLEDLGTAGLALPKDGTPEVEPSEGGGDQNAEDTAGAGGETMETSDYNAGRRFKKILRLLQSTAVQRPVRQFRINAFILIFVLTALQVGTYILMRTLVNEQMTSQTDMTGMGLSARLAANVAITTRSIDILFRNGVEPSGTSVNANSQTGRKLQGNKSELETWTLDPRNGPALNALAAPAVLNAAGTTATTQLGHRLLQTQQGQQQTEQNLGDVLAALDYLSNGQDSLSQLLVHYKQVIDDFVLNHASMFLGHPSEGTVQLPTFKGLRDLWTKPSLTVLQFIRRTSDIDVHPVQAVLMSLSDAGFELSSKAAYIWSHAYTFNTSANGTGLSAVPELKFVLANYAGAVAPGYTRSMDDVMQFMIHTAKTIDDVQLVVLLAEGVGLCTLAVAWVWWLSHLVTTLRFQVFSAFVVVPNAMVRALATRKLELSLEEDDDDGDDSPSPQQGGAGSSRAAGTTAGTGPATLPPPPAATNFAAAARGSLNVFAAANGSGAGAGTTSGKGSIASSKRVPGSGGAPGGNWWKSATLAVKLGLRARQGAPAPRRTLKRSYRTAVWLVWPIALWGILIILIAAVGRTRLYGVGSHIATINVIDVVHARYLELIFTLQEWAAGLPVATTLDAVQASLVDQITELEVLYSIMLHGKDAVVDNHSSLYSKFVVDGTSHSTATHTMYRTEECLHSGEHGACKVDSPFYEYTNHGLHRMLLRFMEVVSAVVAAEGRLQLNSTDYAYIWNTNDDISDGLVTTQELFSDAVNEVYMNVTELYLILLILSTILAVFYAIFIIRPFLNSMKHETRRVAELLSQLPSEADVENLLKKLLGISVPEATTTSTGGPVAARQQPQRQMSTNNANTAGKGGLDRNVSFNDFNL